MTCNLLLAYKVLVNKLLDLPEGAERVSIEVFLNDNHCAEHGLGFRGLGFRV